MSDLTEEIVEGSLWGGFARFLERAGSLVFIIILARFLLPDIFGLYSLVMSIALIFMTFADLGISQTLIRYFSLNLNNKKKATSYFQYIFKLKVLVSLIVSFALLISAYPIAFWLYKKPELFLPLILASVFILTSLFVHFFSSFFYAIKKVRYIGMQETIFQTLRIIMVVLIFSFIASLYYIFGIFLGLILTNLIMLLFLFFVLRKLTPFVFEKTEEKPDKIKVLKFLGYTTIGTISGVLDTNTDIIMLGFFVSFAFLGYYKIASSLIFGLAGLFSYLGSVLLPFFTSLKGRKLETAFNNCMRIILVFSIPTVFGTLALGKYFIRVLYKHSHFLLAVPSFYILSFMLLTYIPVMILASLFYSKGKPKYVTKVVVLSLILNIILNYIFISFSIKISESLAISGAAAATVIAKFFAFFYLTILTKKELNITLKKKNFVKPVVAGLLMFSVLYLISLMVKEINLFIGIMEIVLGIIIYFFIMFLIKGISKQDIFTFKKIPKIILTEKINRFFYKTSLYWKGNKIYALKYMANRIGSSFLDLIGYYRRKKIEREKKYKELMYGKKEIIFDMDYGKGIRSRIILSPEDKGLSLDLLINRIREPLHVKWMHELLKPDMRVVDIGANLGYYALMEAKLVKKVYGIEPNPETFKYLKRSVKLNKLKNVKLLNMAIGDKKDILPFFVSESWNWSRFLDKEKTGKDIKKEIKVKVDKLDNLFIKQKIDLVRMDVEGYEINIIKGMEKIIKNSPELIIVLEFHSNQFNYEEKVEFIDLLKNFGFRIKYMAEPNSNKTKENVALNKLLLVFGNCYLVLEKDGRK